MAWRTVRIDFAEPCKCRFCQKPINCGIAHIVVNDSNEEACAGPSCAKKPEYVSNPKEKVPNITSGYIRLPHLNGEDIETGTVSGGQRERQERNDGDSKQRNAIAYLLLRVERLKHITGVHYQALNPIYERYKSNSMTPNDYNFLAVLINSEKLPQYSLKNLKALHVTSFWIEYFIRTNKSADLTFMKSVRNTLYKNLRISNGQINGINKWFKNANPRITLQLREDLFDR